MYILYERFYCTSCQSFLIIFYSILKYMTDTPIYNIYIKRSVFNRRAVNKFFYPENCNISLLLHHAITNVPVGANQLLTFTVNFNRFTSTLNLKLPCK